MKQSMPTKIPIYNEIIIDGLNTEQLRQRLASLQIGSLPYYIVIHEQDQQVVIKRINSILSIVEELGLSVYFPYPLYIITTKLDQHPNIQISPSVEELPRYFFKKIRRLKPKEISILNKNKVLSSKISNENILKKHRELKSMLKKNRELSNISREIDFYQKITEKRK